MAICKGVIVAVFAFLLGITEAFVSIHVERKVSMPLKSSLMMVMKKNKDTTTYVKPKNKNEGDRIGSTLKTMQDYVNEFHKLKTLSEEAPDLSLTKSAQSLFDTMFKKWFENDNDELEPDTEIYNLLLSIYANCGEMKITEKLLHRMETGRADYVPEPNIKTYLNFMKGWMLKGNLDEARSVFDRIELCDKCDVQVTIEICNSFLELLIQSNEGNKAAKLSEDMINRMITNENCSYPVPNTETFSLVLSCIIRHSDKGRNLKVRDSVKRLIEKMENIQGVNPYHGDVVNMNIKSISDVSRTEADAFQAEHLLFNMLERYKTKPVLENRPNASAFINTIRSWKYVKSDQAPLHARKILNILNDFYVVELDHGNSVENLKPDNRVYNACLDVIARSNSCTKSIEAQELLQDMNQIYHRNGDIDFAPNQRTFNNIINACAFTEGGYEVSKEALRIMFDVFKQMKNSDRFQPNQATYGMILKGCSNLVADITKRKNLVEPVFRACCKEGYCSDFVIESMILATDSEFAQLLCGLDFFSGGSIPEEWRRNLKQ